MADANGLQGGIRPTGFFNIKKMTADKREMHNGQYWVFNATVKKVVTLYVFSPCLFQ